MESVIKLLKDNEKPFGLMSEEMQAKMRDVDAAAFQRFSARDNGTWCDHDMTDRVFLYDVPYRLRPDYEDEPEIVECEIYSARDGNVYIDVYDFEDEEEIRLDVIPVGYKRIGFKFEDGNMSASPVRYRNRSGAIWHTVPLEDVADFEVLHATHVLFRRKKQE